MRQGGDPALRVHHRGHLLRQEGLQRERPDGARHLRFSARELGYAELAERYGRLADEVTRAFRARYLLPDGRMTSDAPTAYSVALVFDLLDGARQRRRAGARLAELVLRDEARIATGFVGTPLICDALTDTGHLDVAYRLLPQTGCPSWLCTVSMGATTIGERWDGLLPDGTLNSGGMTSFNHYALGAVADWMHRVVAGLDLTSPGYRTLRYRPRPGGGITWAKARHETPYGPAAISWEPSDAGMTAQVTVPDGCRGVVEPPGHAPLSVGPGLHRLDTRDLERAAA